jgi:hypothetical protein
MGPRSQYFFRSPLQFTICLFLYTTLCGNHTSDNHGCSSETSFQHDAPLASAESFNAAKHTATYLYHTTAAPQTSGLLSHNTSLPASCSGSFQLVDATRESTGTLTRQALQQHDFEYKSADVQRPTQYPHAQYNVSSNNMVNITGHTSLSAGYDHPAVGQSFYPHNSRHCPHLLGCDTSPQGYTYGHNMDDATWPPQQPTKLQGSHPYPVFIDEEEISYNSGSSGTHVEHLAVKQEWIQASAHSSTDLAGVGAQFSW